MLNNMVYEISKMCMMVGGMIPYCPQYYNLLYNSNFRGAVSPGVCLLLVSAHALRLMFWYWHPFDRVYVIQSTLHLLFHLSLLRMISNRRTTPLRVRKWTNACLGISGHRTPFQNYLFTLCTGASVLLLLLSPFRNHTWLGELLGLVSLGLEACIAMPQWYQNHKRGHTHGLSRFMVSGWVIGDSFKTTFAFLTHAPLQFLLCGCVQLLTSTAIIIQFSKNHQRPSCIL